MSYKAKVFGLISFVIALITGLIVMSIEPRASVIAAIVTFPFTFWMLCIFTNTSEAQL